MCGLWFRARSCHPAYFTASLRSSFFPFFRPKRLTRPSVTPIHLGAPEPSLGTRLAQYELTLDQLERATTPAAFNMARQHLIQLWPDVLETAAQVQRIFSRQEQELAAAGLPRPLGGRLSAACGVRPPVGCSREPVRELLKTAVYPGPAALAEIVAGLRGRHICRTGKPCAVAAAFPSALLPTARPDCSARPAHAGGHRRYGRVDCRGCRRRRQPILSPLPRGRSRLKSNSLPTPAGRDPVSIYAYVRNTIAYEPYYGSRKGALLTLWERSGNDADIASLLIALLHASGYAARTWWGPSPWTTSVPATG